MALTLSQLARQRRWVKNRRANGLCLRCNTKIDVNQHRLCEACLAKNRERKRRIRMKKAGMIDEKRVMRIEVIDEGGLKYMRRDCAVRISVHDSGRTLKLFIVGKL